MRQGPWDPRAPDPFTHSFTGERFWSISHLPGTVLGCGCSTAQDRLPGVVGGVDVLRETLGCSFLLRYCPTPNVSSPPPTTSCRTTGQTSEWSRGTASGPWDPGILPSLIPSPCSKKAETRIHLLPLPSSQVPGLALTGCSLSDLG